MLRQLRVGNLALAADVAVPFAEGLTVMTGETGAGKSLIAGALALLTGGRAEKDLIRGGEELAYVEGVFDLADHPQALAAAERAGLRVGQDGVLVLRRELRRESRGRVLINGLVSSLALLEEIGGRLIAVQSQDQQRRLGLPSFAADFLDGALDLGALRTALAAALERWRLLEAELAERRQEEAFAGQQLDMWQWQHRELEGAGLDAAEEAALAEQIAVGRGARGLLEAAGAARQELAEGQVNAAQLLGAAARRLERVAGTSGRLDEVLRQVLDAQAAAEDAARGLERFLDSAELDPARLDELEERKALYEELQRKYRRDVAGLVVLQEDLRERIARQASAGSDLAELTGRCGEARDEVGRLCLELRGPAGGRGRGGGGAGGRDGSARCPCPISNWHSASSPPRSPTASSRWRAGAAASVRAAPTGWCWPPARTGARPPATWRASPAAASARASTWGWSPWGWVTTSGRCSCSTRSTRAWASRGRCRWRRCCRTWRDGGRCCASPTCRRWRPGGGST